MAVKGGYFSRNRVTERAREAKMDRKVYTEYSDGSYLMALVRDGQVISCPVIKLCPPADRGSGSVSLDQAIDFLLEIKKAVEETGV